MIQFIRGNTAANDAYTGPNGSLSIDTEADSIRLHDGVTPGGVVIASIDQTGAIDTNAFTDSEKTKLGGIEDGAEVNAVDSVNGQTGAVVIPNADENSAGLVSTGAQTFAGDKTFQGVVTIDEGGI